MHWMEEQGWIPTEDEWCRFIDKLSPAEADEDDALGPTLDKICVLAKQENEFGWVLNFLYYIDLSSACEDGDNCTKPLSPLFRFYSGYGNLRFHSHVVVGSKLYMMGGWDERERRGYWSGQWGCYDFRDHVYSPAPFLKKKRIVMGEPMKGRKYKPVAAVVGGYKICVFATLIYDGYQAEKGNRGWGPPNFEVLDTRDPWGSWTELPEPVSNYGEFKMDRIYIRSYCVERTCLIISTDIGMYGIKVDAEEPKWVKLEGSGRIKVSCVCDRWMVLGKNVCSEHEVMRWGEKHPCPLAFKNKLAGDYDFGGLCSEGVKDGVILCSVRGRLGPVPRDGSHSSFDRFPLLHVNLVRVGSTLLGKLRREDWGSLPTDKSSLFEINSMQCYAMEVAGIFPFEETRKKKMEDDHGLRRSKRLRSLPRRP